MMNWQNLIEQDQRWSLRMRIRQEGGFWFRIAAFFAHSGDSWFWLAGLAIVWLFANPAWHYLSTLMILAILGLAVTVLFIKFRIRRRRPDGEWGAIYRSTDPHSFPSGHAARAGMLAIVALGIGPLWFGVLLLVWAPLVGLARVVMGVHYVSDVIAGLVLGVLVGGLVILVQPVIVAIVPFIF